MSKTPSHPTILKKEDHQRPSRAQSHQPIQPKILTKSTNKENVPAIPVATKKVVENEGPVPPQLMKKSQRLIVPHFQLEHKISDYLEADNSDFLVVAVVGGSQVGKSTMVKIL